MALVLSGTCGSRRSTRVIAAGADPDAGFVSVAIGSQASTLCPMCAPRLQPRCFCLCNMHVNHVMLTANHVDAMPSQREGQGFGSP
jgi:hypothetical protein